MPALTVRRAIRPHEARIERESTRAIQALQDQLQEANNPLDGSTPDAIAIAAIEKSIQSEEAAILRQRAAWAIERKAFADALSSILNTHQVTYVEAVVE